MKFSTKISLLSFAIAANSFSAYTYTDRATHLPNIETTVPNAPLRRSSATGGTILNFGPQSGAHRSSDQQSFTHRDDLSPRNIDGLSDERMPAGGRPFRQMRPMANSTYTMEPMAPGAVDNNANRYNAIHGRQADQNPTPVMSNAEMYILEQD